MGGTLSVQSVRGAGATFQFTISVEVPDEALAAPPPAADCGPEAGAPASPAAKVAGGGRARRIAPALVARAGGELAAADLDVLTPELRGQLKVALQELNLARVALLLAPLPPSLAPVVERIEHMVRLHQYPQLCLLLDQLPDQAGSELEAPA